MSWALTTACTSRFQEVSPDSHSLSLTDIWRWIPTALEEVNSSLKPEEQKLSPPIILNEVVAGDDGTIWLTEQRRASPSKFAPDELTRKKYLESVYKRYSSVTFPLGPAEGFSLHAVFQPLELRRDPLAAEDLDRKKRRPFLGECLEDEKDADRLYFQHNEKERADEKQRPVIAENGEDALTKSPQRRVVILGGPGTGKTTTLKHITGCRAKEALTDPNALIPIFLSLADLARSQKTLQSYLVDLVEELGVEHTYAETLWKAIQAGQAFVCLDSLDEVEPQRRQKMIEWVNTWAAEPGNTWMIGSRFTEYKGGSFKHGRFAEWELLPMDHQLRLELAERLLPELQRLLQGMPEQSQSPVTFVKRLEDHPQAATWGENPLLFSLATVVFLRTGDLPSSRAILYRAVIDAIFETRETDLVQRKVLRHVLSDLALELYKTKGRTFSLDDLLALLPIIRQRQHENWITEEMARRIVNSGMLDVLARETYSFRHQTFQEYLAAVELAQRLTHHDQAVREKAWEFAWGKRTYSHWTEVLRLMVGVLSQQLGNKGKSVAQHWLQELIGQRSTEEGDPGNLGLALALKSLAEIPKDDESEKFSIGRLQQKIVFIWLDELLRTGYNPVGRRTKWWRLQPLSRDVFHIHGREVDKALEHLIKTLWSKNKNERDSACELLRELGQRVPLKQLLVALNDPDARIRVAAIRSLRGQGDCVPLEHLLDALHDQDSSVRRAAVEALGEQGARVSLEHLLGALHDQDSSVRRTTVEALGKQGERVPLEHLLDALHDQDRFVRRTTVEALGKQGERVPLEYLLDALHDENWAVRRVAVEALGRQGERVPLEHLLDALHDQVSFVRWAAVEALGKQGERVPLEHLLDALHDKDESVRRAAVAALGKQRERVPLEHLLDALHDQVSFVRQEAVLTLGKQAERVPLDHFLEAVGDEDKDVSLEGIKVLSKRAPDALSRLTNEAIAILNQQPAGPILGSIAKTSFCKLAGELTLALPAVLNELTELLVWPHWQVRTNAAKALGSIRRNIPDTAIRRLLGLRRQDPVRVVREAADDALAEILSLETGIEDD